MRLVFSLKSLAPNQPSRVSWIGPRLHEVVAALPSETCSRLSWKITSSYGVGATQLGNLPALEHEVESSRSGLNISWEDLAIFANEVSDIFDISILGYDGSDSHDEPPNALDADCRIMLERCDSSFWKCSFHDDKLGAVFSKKISDLGWDLAD